MSVNVQDLVKQMELKPSLPEGPEERFNGYAVMGLPFSSGHILAMRRFPTTSIGPGYTSVWHRNPQGEWVFYFTNPPQLACSRYYGAFASDAFQTDVNIAWESPEKLHVSVPMISLEWEVVLGSTLATGLMNGMGRMLPNAAWHSMPVLDLMAMMAGPMLSIGHIALNGKVPNGQHFIANPRILWEITHSWATIAGENLGTLGPLQDQAHMVDFWLPQKGIFAVGQMYFEPFDPARHSSSIAGLKKATV